MATYLADTNLLLRIADPASSQNAMAVEALAQLFRRGDEVFLTPQNYIEFWAVTTRPAAANVFGWSRERVTQEIGELQKRFPLLDELSEVFTRWLALVKQFSVTCKRVHDARLVAVLQVHAVRNLIAFNLADFVIFPSLSLVDPHSLTAS